MFAISQELCCFHAPCLMLCRMGDFRSARRILDRVLDKLSAASSHFKVGCTHMRAHSHTVRSQVLAVVALLPAGMHMCMHTQTRLASAEMCGLCGGVTASERAHAHTHMHTRTHTHKTHARCMLPGNAPEQHLPAHGNFAR